MSFGLLCFVSLLYLTILCYVCFLKNVTQKWWSLGVGAGTVLNPFRNSKKKNLQNILFQILYRLSQLLLDFNQSFYQIVTSSETPTDWAFPHLPPLTYGMCRRQRLLSGHGPANQPEPADRIGHGAESIPLNPSKSDFSPRNRF